MLRLSDPRVMCWCSDRRLAIGDVRVEGVERALSSPPTAITTWRPINVYALLVSVTDGRMNGQTAQLGNKALPATLQLLMCRTVEGCMCRRSQVNTRVTLRRPTF
jgi:hypothetical protein